MKIQDKHPANIKKHLHEKMKIAHKSKQNKNDSLKMFTPTPTHTYTDTNEILTLVLELLKAFVSGKFFFKPYKAFSFVTARKKQYFKQCTYDSSYIHITHRHNLTFIAQKSIKVISFVNVKITNRIAPYL